MVQHPVRPYERSPQHPASSSDGYVVGVDLGGTSLRMALADGGGSIHARWTASTRERRDPRLIVELLCKGVTHLLQQAALPHSVLRAIAVGAPGVTDFDAGVVIATSYLMGWRDVPLRHLLESELGIPAAVDNDVNVATAGESWRGAAQGVRDFVFVAIGTGVGAGIMLEGEVFRGTGWVAGEIGYMLVPGVSEAPIAAGAPGALEGLVGGEGIRAYWASLSREEQAELPADLIATEIFDAALAGNTAAQRVLKRAARALAYAIHNVALVLNCPLFVLGGSVGVHPALCEALEAVLAEQGSRATPKLLRSSLGTDAQLIGAVRLALETARTRSSVEPPS